MTEETLMIADAIQYNLKALQRLRNAPSYSTVYNLLCGQVDTLIEKLEEEYDEDSGD